MFDLVEEALRLKDIPSNPEPEALRRLEPRARIVLGLFAKQETVTATQVAERLGLSERMARNLVQEWVGQGWLIVSDKSRRKRAYTLSAMQTSFSRKQKTVPV